MIFLTDEATFTGNRALNMCNMQYENQYAMQEDRFQHDFLVNVWFEIINIDKVTFSVISFKNNLMVAVGLCHWFQINRCHAH